MDQEQNFLEPEIRDFTPPAGSLNGLMCYRGELDLPEILSRLKLESENRVIKEKAAPGRLNDLYEHHTVEMRLEQLKNLAKAFVQIVSSAATDPEAKRCSDRFNCAYCYGLLFEPVTLPCGSTFCRSCFTKELLSPCRGCGKLHSSLLQEGRHLLKVTTRIANAMEKLFPEETKASELRKEGNEFIFQKNYETAVEKYSQGLLHAPKDHVLYSNRSYAYVAQRKYEEALLDIEKACSFEPTWPKAHFRKGSILLKMNRMEEAMVSFVQCIKMDKNVGNQICQEINRHLDHVFQAESPNSSKSSASSADSVSHIILSEAMIGKIQTALAAFTAPNVFDQEAKTLKACSPINPSNPVTDTTDKNSINEIEPKISPEKEKNEVLSETVVDKSNATNSVLPTSAEAETAEHPLTSNCNGSNKRKHFNSDTSSSSSNDSCDLHLPTKLTTEFDPALVCKEDYECPICSRLIYEPVTTPCGHTFCRVCLDRCLDHMDTCPLCKSSLAHFMADKHNVITKLLDWFLWTYLKEETIKRKTDYEDEMNDLKKIRYSSHRCEVPIFVCTVAMPTIPCSLHIFEPRYRLMVRRCLESGCKQFGMCLPSDDTNRRYEDYGCMLEIDDTQFLPDGRSLLETTGKLRFKVINRGMRDGYDIAIVEFIKDEQVEGPELEELSALQKDVYGEVKLWFESIQDLQRATIVNYYGNLPEMDSSQEWQASGPAWHWWALRVLPIHTRLQLRIMQKAKLKDRLLSIRRILGAIPQGLVNPAPNQEAAAEQ